MVPQWAPNSEPRRPTVYEREVRVSSNVGYIHRQPLPHSFYTEAASSPFYGSGINGLAGFAVSHDCLYLTPGYLTVALFDEVMGPPYTGMARGVMYLRYSLFSAAVSSHCVRSTDDCFLRLEPFFRHSRVGICLVLRRFDQRNRSLDAVLIHQ
ncbi:hypothetical protein M513_09042 [Trichuris suis]|uniref:Uncharacterized protein n=1 Tax=Trichuris suis TaxID=68888 RepID=A0A085LLS5_9BILA|nr:hypothetical protein M513_13206 [Trichuris suis]KFD50082.1 hypothetical protein M513_09042 [Trichuris suis]